MNLKNNNITVAELLKNPSSKAILTEEFPQYINHPMIGFAGYMPLRKVLEYANGRVPKEKINHALERLKNC